jgi:DnaJ-class molecular chaperone
MAQVTAQQAFARAAELQDKPRRVTLINHCPDCLGTGKVNGKTCTTCGNEPDDTTNLTKRGSCWYRSN